MRTFRNIVISVILGVVISLAVIYVQTGIIKSNITDFYLDSHDRITVNVLERGNNIYVSDREDVPKSSIDKRKDALDLAGGAFKDSDKQMRSNVTGMVSGLNSADVYGLGSGKKVLTDNRVYFDETGKSILMEDTLIFVRRNSNNKGELYYTFHDDEMSEKIRKLVDRQRNDSNDLVFTIDGIYAKGDEFIPGKVYCQKVEDGRKSDIVTLYESDKTGEELKEEGYDFYKVDSFNLGAPTRLSTYCEYYYSIDKEQSDRIEELLKPYIESGMQDGEGDYIVNNLGPLGQEMFFVSKYVSPDTGKGYYAVSYQKINVLYESDLTGGIKSLMLPYLFLFIGEMVLIVIVAIVIAIIVSAVMKKRQ